MNYNEIIAKTMKQRQFGQHKALVSWGYDCYAHVDSDNKDLAGFYYRKAGKNGVTVGHARLTPGGAVEHL